ncbi:unnamed protein product [Phytophthora fragariaefolia]|uniref:Unnamed protein product n=1 Tax=Phytophthora fragariaefolia TaxID=1490495 RepID=A0A9W6TSD8_9STRA|nr:unnamed protein product [Phytophthora fragariaefolia]
MQTTALYPPNWLQLSERIVGNVIVRQSANKRNFPIEAEDTPDTLKVIQSTASVFSGPPTKLNSSLIDPRMKGGQDDYKQLSTEQSLARYRRTRRDIQRRYRKKLENKTQHLQAAVVQLQVEIQRLQEIRDRPSRSLTTMTPYNVVVDLWRLFRYGFKPLVPLSEIYNASAGFANVQAGFCRTVMVPDVQCNAGYGVETGLENWRLITLHHEKLDIERKRLECGAEDSVIAYMNAHSTITANMLRQALPDLISDERWELITQKLIGQQIVVPGTLRLDWDASTDKVVRTHFDVDMLTPLLALLGNSEDASRVLCSALAIDHWSGTEGC